ncbi:aminopeptidase N [Actinoplanes sp. NPDC048988]|uniref:aminopeptidase N n=1 Tax=Actinoplanes sp. NPDC048988 TaxID=3363901 RepID=UPI00371CAD10
MDPRSLTQAEAEQRAALIAVERYDIAIDFTELPTGPGVTCVSTVTFTCREPGASTFADCVAPVLSATLNGKPLPEAEEGRILLSDLAQRNTLRVETRQTDTADGPGVHKSVDPADGEVYVWTTFAPDEARHLFACFDQPDLKAPHAFTVTAPDQWIVGSNTGDPEIHELAGVRVWAFPDTPPLATYNTVVNAGPLHEIRREAGGHDLGLFCRRSLAAVLDRDADEIFTVTEQGLAFFADVFGMPFPQRKYDQMFMPDFGGAMENWGCVTWEDSFLRRSEPTPAERETLAVVLLHELSHMWFGNIVTMRWWDDLWLNEAFAEFACYWAAERATRHTDARVGMLASDKLIAYLADQGPMSHPIRQPMRDVAEAASIFDAITYPKGAAVLYQLMVYVGEERFVAGMKSYFARYAWGSTTLQDLMDALAEASGRDLDAWRAGWLETAGTDRFTFDGRTLTGTGPAGPPRPQVLAVGAYDRGPAGLTRTALARVDVRGGSTPVTLPEGADLYLVNDEDLTFATTRPSATDRPTLIDDAGALPTPVSRGVAVATVWDMLTNAEATPAETVRCVASVLAVETADTVVEPYLRLAGDAAEYWAGDTDRPALMAEFFALCARLAEQPARRQVALRGLARSAPDLDAVAMLQSGADVDLSWRLLIRKAELGGDTRAEVDDLLKRDPDPDASHRALAVRAARPDAAEKSAMWQMLAVDRAVPLSAVRTVTTAFWRPGQNHLLSGFGPSYLSLLPTFDRGGMVPSMVYSGRLLPRFAIDADFLTRADQTAAGVSPVVRQTVLEVTDELRRMLRTRR